MSPWYWKSIRSILSRPDSHRRLLAATELHPQKNPSPEPRHQKKTPGNAEVTKNTDDSHPAQGTRQAERAHDASGSIKKPRGFPNRPVVGAKGGVKHGETWRSQGLKSLFSSWSSTAGLGHWRFGSLLSHNPQVRSWLFNVSPPVDKGLIQTFSLMLDKAAGYVCRVALTKFWPNFDQIMPNQPTPLTYPPQKQPAFGFP